jgi:hypothetical protein
LPGIPSRSPGSTRRRNTARGYETDTRAFLTWAAEVAEAAGPDEHAIACLLGLNGLRVNEVINRGVG